MYGTAVVPSTSSVTVIEELDGICLNMPGRRSWRAATSLSLWLALWAVWCYKAAGDLLAGPVTININTIFLLAWLVLWTAGGISVVVTVLRLLFGRETVRITGNTLVLRWTVGAVGPSRTFDLAQVNNLRAESQPPERVSIWSAIRVGETQHGKMGFDYGTRSYRFGDGLGEVEARQLVQLLRDRYRELRS